MNSKTVISVLLAMSLSTGGLAFAQGRGDRNNDRNDERGRNEQGERGGQQDRHDNEGRQQDRRDDRGRGYDNQRQDMRQDRQQDRLQDVRHDQRGAGPEHQFYRGQRLPQEYRHRQYVVDDWRGHQLSAPPRGYHWVQTGGDYVLVAIGSGIILQLFLGS